MIGGAGAPIGIEKGDRNVLALCKVVSDGGSYVVLPAGVVGQVWRDGHGRSRLSASSQQVEP